LKAQEHTAALAVLLQAHPSCAAVFQDLLHIRFSILGYLG
jgi:hypothetical protein